MQKNTKIGEKPMEDIELQKLEAEVEQSEATVQREDRKNELLERKRIADQRIRQTSKENSTFYKFSKWFSTELKDLMNSNNKR